ncbi:flavin-containing monooxygenase [Paractinoplanes lichenicola]|uniref:NAD(P)/FAD-dependent oxidoreductase n=1 Tax=Paractinoplanes lichenicola TaxID=2802976 RepID=A0ABS1VMZ2_9ACTN|nr:NAD(P)/FAD-dependent oxidoreductase [Actinoplanes lichenicola]MBL7255973.1 NAD(P)/FAD-dependent oxidoreductase [Actinoplanes lichenicola]
MSAPTQEASSTGDARDVPATADVVIIGAGFAGMYLLHRVRDLGLSAVTFEQAPDVGGTWYWNAYPGARCDVESLLYNYSWDSGLRSDYQYKWPERFSRQPVILEYARHVADRFDLRRDIHFDTRVNRATWDEASRHWIVETDRGDRVRCRFLLSAVGCLSDSQVPKIPGLKTFRGDWYHTGRWPHRDIDFSGRRVVQIGTGSSGVQAAPVIAETAGHLTVLQRTPQFCIPARNAPLTPELVDTSLERLKDMMIQMADRPTVRRLWESFATKKTFDDSPEERQAYFEQLWENAAAAFPFGYLDTMTDPAANEEAAEFVRGKIRSIVQDPATADKLLPSYPIGTKRQIIDTGYYETFNRPNVTLEDIRTDPIERITPDGVLLASGKLVEADIIVFATGFDAMTGPIFRLNIEGVDGRAIQDAWADGPQTYLGLAVHGFPNLFLLTGPGSPSVLSNVIQSAEQHVDWLIALLDHLRDNGIDRIEAEPDAQARWTTYCTDMANESLWPRADSWYMGANIPGKPRVFMPYIGGNALYQEEIDEVAEKNYEGFQLNGATNVAS